MRNRPSARRSPPSGGAFAQHEVLEPRRARRHRRPRCRRARRGAGSLRPGARGTRHAGGERLAAHDERDVVGVAREVQRGLAGGVGAAHDVDVAVGHARRLRRGPAVEHAGAVERLELGDADALVLGAGGQEHRAGADAPAVGELDPEPVVVSAEHRDELHEREVRAEHPRLFVGRLREPAAADPAREPEVVADQRARRGLPADPAAVDHQRVEALRRAVHRGGQPGGPAPTITRSNSVLGGSTGDPDAETSSALVGSRRTVPSGKITSGKPPTPRLDAAACAPSRARPVSRRARTRAASRSARATGAARRPSLPRLADDVDGVRRLALRVGPLQQHPGDRRVEQLVGRRVGRIT